MSENNENISVSHPVALLSCALLHIITGARNAQGAANRRRPLHPRALANKIAAARCPRLIPCGYRVGREVTYMDPCKTRPQPTSMWAAPASRERLGDFGATKQPCGLLIKS